MVISATVLVEETEGEYVVSSPLIGARSQPSGGHVIQSVVQNSRYDLTQQKYVCGHCSTTVMGVVVAAAPNLQRWWLLCPECGKGSVWNDDIILPPPPSFPTIDGLPDDICSLYDEARTSFDVHAYTGCEMLCRKILMNAAVDKNAKKKETFVYYVNYLESNEYVTPALKSMAVIIRKHGNKAAHEIDPPDMNRARHTLVFTRRILDTIYGTEHEMKAYSDS